MTDVTQDVPDNDPLDQLNSLTTSAPSGASDQEPAEADPVAMLEEMTTPTDAPPTTSERVATVGQGATTGFARAAPVVAGAFAGGKVGAALGALGGLAAPVTVPLGAAAGVVIGGLAGDRAGDALQYGLGQVTLPGARRPVTFENMESVPPRLRPYAVGGEVFGASIPFAAAPYVAVRDGIRFAPNLAGRFFNGIIETAGRIPAQFAAAEASAAIGSGLGAATAEFARPGQIGPRIAGEVAGGILNPGRWIIATTRGTVGAARRAILSLSPSGREGEAARVVQNIVREAGGDPKALALALRDSDLPGLKLTAGQKSGSPALLALEVKLSQESAKFGAESKAIAENGLNTVKTLIAGLESSGDPGALRAAAQMRADYFRGLLSTRMHVAQTRALAAAANIAPGRPASTAEFGRAMTGIMEEALSEVRAVERQLWDQVDREIPGEANAVIRRFDELRAELLPEESLPGLVEGFVRRVRGEPPETGLPEGVEALVRQVFGDEALRPAAADSNIPTTTGELMRFRSRMLALSREAAAQSEWSDARIFGELAESALDDLGTIQADNQAFSAARAWSRELHDTFSRTFASQSLSTTRQGAARVPPEMLMRRAFSTGREAGALHFRELEEAARMAGTEHVARLLDTQERTIRFAAAEAIDTVTGRVNPQRLAKFRRDNAELLNRFPEVRDQLGNAEAAERFLTATEAGTRRAQRAIESQAAFSRVLNGEDPATAVTRILRGDNPARDFSAIAKLARRGGEDAQEGLKAAVHSQAYARASRQDGGFAFGAYRDAFLAPVTPNGPTLRQLMQQNGVATKAELDTLSEFLNRASEIELALANREPLEGILNAGDAVFDVVLRVAGAKFGAMTPTGQAHPLIVGAAGSRLARQVFDKVPKVRVRDMLIEASKNPEMMAALLAKPTTQREKIRFARQMNAFLWQIGVTAPEGER